MRLRPLFLAPYTDTPPPSQSWTYTQTAARVASLRSAISPTITGWRVCIRKPGAPSHLAVQAFQQNASLCFHAILWLSFPSAYRARETQFYNSGLARRQLLLQVRTAMRSECGVSCRFLTKHRPPCSLSPNPPSKKTCPRSTSPILFLAFVLSGRRRRGVWELVRVRLSS